MAFSGKRLKENISFYHGNLAMAGLREGEIPRHEYDVVSDKMEEGVRTIQLKERDRAAFFDKCKKLADAIAEKIGEGESKTFKALLFDALKHYWDTDIDRIYDSVVSGKTPVKARKGCFAIIIGDGRRKSADIIQLLD
jgi:hypothetical protein